MVLFSLLDRDFGVVAQAFDLAGITNIVDWIRAKAERDPVVFG
jgi:hypothetical protein